MQDRRGSRQDCQEPPPAFRGHPAHCWRKWLVHLAGSCAAFFYAERARRLAATVPQHLINIPEPNGDGKVHWCLPIRVIATWVFALLDLSFIKMALLLHSPTVRCWGICPPVKREESKSKLDKSHVSFSGYILLCSITGVRPTCPPRSKHLIFDKSFIPALFIWVTWTELSVQNSFTL